MSRAAVVLLSGGLDSATSLAIAIEQGFEVHAITFDYQQRHRVELERAAEIGRHFRVVSHTVFQVDLRQFGGSALTDDIEVPMDTPSQKIGDGIPVTYVPARNLVFLSIAVALAEVRSSTDIFIGVNAVDYSGYPDCRPEFIEAFSRAAGLATKIGIENSTKSEPRVTIHTPLSGLSKADIVSRAAQLGVPLELTISCYSPSEAGLPCRRCEACTLRSAGFTAAGMADPSLY